MKTTYDTITENVKLNGADLLMTSSFCDGVIWVVLVHTYTRKYATWVYIRGSKVDSIPKYFDDYNDAFDSFWERGRVMSAPSEPLESPPECINL